MSVAEVQFVRDCCINLNSETAFVADSAILTLYSLNIHDMTQLHNQLIINLFIYYATM